MARDRKRVDVLILGAGAAGLAAARDLSHAGLSVTIIEARPRVGGRILTQHDSRSPVPLELGAEFIHGERAETLSLAQAAGLAVLELPDTHELAAGGAFKAMDGFWGLVDRMNHDLARRLARIGRDFPVSEYLDSPSVPPARRGMLRDFLQGFYAAHPDRLSAQSLAVEARGTTERDEVSGGQFRIANGGDALMKWLRDGLDPDRTELRLSTVAQTVDWKRGEVRVGCRGADRAPLATVTARTALITLPIAVLKAGMLPFDPALPAKQRALAGLETGQVFKIVLRFREAFWDDAEFLRERRGPSSRDRGALNFVHGHGAEVPTWWTTLPVRSPVLVGYVGAVAAEDILAEEPPSRLERTLVALSEILAVPRRELEDQLDASASHDWHADPFALGAYSYIGVGGIGAPRALGRPVEGTLFFAGEATDGPQIGTVAGALASGRRAAREVLRVLK
jgi:monoamine oxidase